MKKDELRRQLPGSGAKIRKGATAKRAKKSARKKTTSGK